MGRATAYSNSSSQVVLVYFHPFRCNSLLTSVLQPKIAEKSLKPPYSPYFKGSRLFKIIHVEILKVCQQLLLRLATNLCLSASASRANSGKIATFMGLPLFDANVRRPP